MLSSTKSFCEPKFEKSALIAEFYNSVSSIIYCVVAFQKLKQKQEINIVVLRFLLFLIGIGSFLFHSTLTFVGQLCDELCMLAFTLTCIMSMKEKSKLLNETFVNAITMMTCFDVFVYIYTMEYIVFIITFATHIIVLLLGMYTINMKDEEYLFHADVSLLMMLCGLIYWMIETSTCGVFENVHVLHVGWHAFSAVSSLYLIKAIEMINEKEF